MSQRGENVVLGKILVCVCRRFVRVCLGAVWSPEAFLAWFTLDASCVAPLDKSAGLHHALTFTVAQRLHPSL